MYSTTVVKSVCLFCKTVFQCNKIHQNKKNTYYSDGNIFAQILPSEQKYIRTKIVIPRAKNVKLKHWICLSFPFDTLEQNFELNCAYAERGYYAVLA